jgi:hypothetical protein
MKKPKFSFGEGGFKGFMARHAEKFAVGVVGVVALVLIYMGTTVNGLKANQTPEDLEAAITRARSAMDSPTWEHVAPHRQPPGDYESRVSRQRTPTLAELYPIPMPWDRPHFQASAKRDDPDLYPAEKPRVVAITGALAMRAAEDTQDPIIKKQMAAKEKRALEDDDDDAGEDGLLSSGGGRQEFGANGRMIAFDVPGFRPAGGTESVIAKSFNFAVITSLVPHRKLFEEYERVFVNADDFQPSRDQPMYRRLWVERAEVPSSGPTPDPSTLKWTPIRLDSRMVNQFAGPPAELAASSYLDPSLTAPPVPLLMHELDDLIVPEEIPHETDVLGEYNDSPEPEIPGETDDSSGGLFDDDPLGGNSGIDGVNEGIGGPRRPTSGGGVKIPGEGGRVNVGQAAASEASKFKLVRYYDFTIQPGKSYVYRCRYDILDPNDPPSDIPSGGVGSQRGGEGGSSGNAPSARFLSAEAAQRIANKNNETAQKYLERALKYKDTDLNMAVAWYKAAVQLNAKNTELTPKAVADQLIPKLAAVGRTASTLASTTSSKLDIHWRESDWSKVSDPVTLPQPGKMLAGQVSQPEPTAKLKEPTAKVVAVVWDDELAVEVPAEIDVHRGTVLNSKSDVEVLHPVTLQIMDIGEKQVKTDGIVLDLKGGDEVVPSKYVAGKKKPGVTGLGEVLIADAEGNLIVRDQYADVADYRRYMFTQDEEATLEIPGAELLDKGPDFPGQGGFEGLIPLDGGRGRNSGRDR